MDVGEGKTIYMVRDSEPAVKDKRWKTFAKIALMFSHTVRSK